MELGRSEIADAVGEMYVFWICLRATGADDDYSVRAPTADLPNVAAFLGGIVAQEAIKMITKQYIPVNGYCVIDLVDTWTGVLAL